MKRGGSVNTFFENSDALAGTFEGNAVMGETASPAYLEETENRSIENTTEWQQEEIMEARALEPEIRYDVPGCEAALVTGDPFGNAVDMDFQQGDNPYGAHGNCGLVSIVNMLRRGELPVSEDQITKYAIDSGLCVYDPYGDMSENGGTTAEMRQMILAAFGIESDIGTPQNGGTIEDIADAIDSGKGVLISVNAGVLWDCDDGSALVDGRVQVNHCVAVTGVARDASTGEITGIYIADSGRGLPEDACRYLTVDEVNEMYTEAVGSSVNITRNPIMEV